MFDWLVSYKESSQYFESQSIIITFVCAVGSICGEIFHWKISIHDNLCRFGHGLQEEPVFIHILKGSLQNNFTAILKS